MAARRAAASRPAAAPLELAAGLTLPVEAVTETFAIVGQRGSGKSSTARVFVEELHGSGQPVIVLDPKGDWWGLRTSSDGRHDGLPFVILGGDHGDLPLTPESGSLVAETLVAARASAVLDLSAMSKTRMRHFVADFATTLYRTNKGSTLHLVVDEADDVVPQRVTADLYRLLGAMEDVAKRGRSRGIGLTVVTQRPQDVSKSVLDLMETLIVMRVVGPRVRNAVTDWVDAKNDDDTGHLKTVLASLKSLPIGQGWLYSPGWLQTLERVTFRPIHTFDTHRTPRPGDKPITAQRAAAVDIDALGQQMTALAKQVLDDDPKSLRARALTAERRALQAEGELARVRQQPPAIVPVAAVPQPVRDAAVALQDALHQHEADLEHVAQLLEASRTRIHAATTAVYEAVRQAANETADTAARVNTTTPSTPPATADLSSARGVSRPRPQSTASQPASHEPPSSPRRSDPDPVTGFALGKAHRSILAVLAAYGTRPLSSVAVLTGYSASGGGFRNALGALRSAGLIEGRGDVTITPAGRDAIGSVPPLPTGPELREHWKSQSALGRAHALILDALAQEYPASVPVPLLATRTGYAADGGGFRNALGRLRTLGLVHGRGELVLDDDLAG